MIPGEIDLGTIGERIRALRKKKGMSQKALAARIGIQESTLSRYENDKRTYQWDGLLRLADALDTSVDYLLGRTTLSAPIGRLVSDEKAADGETSLLEAYCNLRPDDQNLLMERALTLYDLRKRDKDGE
ncbi:MAG: helix-turn-helix domain-containing protein [Clostridiales Family XIII bacterium]|jgi:transcriptional regulator with XRE-family HTH domain|nr:helix-turn-helix domain-containing protein [Clostridiales Family XIII bacterium]